MSRDLSTEDLYVDRIKRALAVVSVSASTVNGDFIVVVDGHTAKVPLEDLPLTKCCRTAYMIGLLLTEVRGL